MRITGGKYRGKNIEAREDRGLRPTSGRIREAVFNILNHGRFLKNEKFIDDGSDSLIEGKRVVDIFCGTGALGLEALSRGAAHVTLIDQDSRTLNLARQNAANLNELSSVSFVRSDSSNLPKAKIPCHLAFIDPPYNMGLETKGLVSLDKNNWLEDGAIVIVEQSKQEDLIPPEHFTLLDSRVHDRTRIVILQYSTAS